MGVGSTAGGAGGGAVAATGIAAGASFPPVRFLRLRSGLAAAGALGLAAGFAGGGGGGGAAGATGGLASGGTSAEVSSQVRYFLSCGVSSAGLSDSLVTIKKASSACAARP